MTEENKETKIINGRSYTLCRECKKARIVDFDLASIKEKVASLVAFLQEGGTVFAARDNIVSQYEWLAIRKQQPKLASRLRLMSRKNSIARRKNAFQNGTLRWVGATNSNVPSPVVRNWSDREIVEAATNAVPRYIPVDDRQEIIAAMVLACIEGGLTPNAMAKRWIEFRKEHTKFYNPRFNPLAADRQRHLPVLSMEGTMLFSQDSDGVALGTTLSNGFWNTSLNPEEFLIAKEGELT